MSDYDDQAANLRRGSSSTLDTSSGTAFNTSTGDNPFTRLWTGKNASEHNEAIFDWQRNEHSAQTAREWDKMMSDTAIQRSVADYQAAGFSPLAALQGGGASTPSAAVGSGSKANTSGSGKELTSILSTLAMLVGGAVGSAAKVASAKSISQAKIEASKIAHAVKR
ncbi:minor capsid protein [Capybara microvirus Cap3_SP_449]|nr:minor capsid protein [Capybara microvirus Cap3_SP_449]